MSKKNIYFYISVICFVLLSNRAGASDLPYKEGELVVRFAPKTNGKQRTTDERNQILSSLNAGEVKHSIKLVPGLSLVKLPENLKVKDALSKFKGKREFLYVEPNYKIRIASTFPNDPSGPKPSPDGGQQWGLHNIGQTLAKPDADIDAPEAWDIATDSNIIVAVIDTGVDYTHPDLAANMWVNQGEIPNNGIDDDGNGYIDDIYGYDFCTFGEHQRDSDPMDDHGHGTHCAGIIGAVGNNGVGVTGVCWNVKIMALKFIDSSEGGWSYDAISCIDYAVEMGAKVLSNSWGCYERDMYLTDVQALKDAIAAANEAGVLFIASAGNDGVDNDAEHPVYPASYDCENIISVMATDAFDARSIWGFYGSNYGATTVDLGAPGSYILSCVPYNIYGQYYGSGNGTSMAAPHVAGACALVWSMNRTLNHLRVKDIILNSVDKLSSLDGLCVTEGRLNLYNAVSNTPLSPAPTLYKVDDVPDGNCVTRGDYVTYTIYYDYNCPGMCPDINNAALVDQLPQQIDPFDIYASNGGVYDMDSRTVTWNLGTLSPGDSNCFTLRVRIAEAYESWSMATNVCQIKQGTTIHSFATEQTPLGLGGRVRNMTREIWYDLIQEAVNYANSGDTIQVWPGTYVENIRIADKNIILRSTDPTNKDVAARTIIYGERDDDSWPVISLENTTGSIVNGFTITHGYYGIYYVSSSAEISYCIVENNYSAGIFTDTSNPTITHTIVENRRGEDGIVVYGGNPYIAYCLIRDTGGNGIFLEYPETATIINNWIHNNYASGILLIEPGTATIINNWIHNNGDCGILFSNPDYQPIIRNNTICGNYWGIYCYGSDAIILNCILFGNLIGGDLGGVTFNNVNYCCLQTEHSGDGNIWGDANDPNFIDGLHISADSPCRNNGDSNGIPPDETDIDGEGRINGRVDIGADEYYRSPDFDESGTVDFKDYAILANNWLLSCSGPNWCSGCDLDQSGLVNTADLKLFCQNWLWQPGGGSGWMFESQGGQMMMAQNQAGVGLQKIADETGAQIAIQEAEIEQEQIVLTEADVKEMLEWTDAIEAEVVEAGLSSPGEYEIFRQSLEKDLLGMLQSAAAANWLDGL